MRKILKRSLVVSLVLVLCMSSILTTQAAKKIKSKSVSLETTKVTLSVGDIVTLRANMKPINSTDTIKWSTSNKKVATVNKYGVVTAVKEGSVIITAKTSSKKTAKCKVTVKKYLTSSEITKLIEKKCLSEESIKKLIKSNSLSEADVITLIKQNSIDEETVKTLVQNNTMSEEAVKKLITENTLSEDTVKALISENTISEEDVKEIVKETVDGTSTDWEDGTELAIYGELPPYQGEGGIVISDISIKKYHCTDMWNGKKQKYKYVIEVDGTMPEHNITEDDTYRYYYIAGVVITYLNDSYYFETGYSMLMNESIGDVNYVYTEDGDGTFHAIIEQYGFYCDYDSFLISNLYFGYDREEIVP